MKTLNKTVPKVSLVGAGPGDKDLLTLKAVKVLGEAKVVLYDALVNEEILEYAPNAVKLFVGKRKGCHPYMQEQINDLLTEYALKYRRVVHLKGGDPFVFGRGREEMRHLINSNIEVEVIPGISSAIGVATMNRIPVTHRGVSESFWVLTATTSNHRLPEDMKLAAQSNATVVVLMGMHKLSDIVSIYKAQGRSATAVAVIQNGTKTNARRAIGNISTIERKVAKQNISTPAIIIIGEVVRMVNDEFFDASSEEFIYQNLSIEL